MTSRYNIPVYLLLLLVAFVVIGCGMYSIEDDSADSETLPEFSLYIKTTSPSLNERDVKIDTAITVIFTKPVNPDTLSSNSIIFTRADSSNDVSGQYQYLEASNTLIFKPNLNLAYSTKYSMEFTDRVRDKEGNTLVVAQLSFKTLSPPIAQISTGFKHSCVLMVSGKVKCWGRNNSGTLGYADSENIGDDSGEMGANLPTTQLGNGAVVSRLSSGFGSNCAIINSGQLKCWGDNSHGQLGLNDTEYRGDNDMEMADYLPYVELGTDNLASSVVVGEIHTCVVSTNQKVKCWGTNSYGHLGLGLSTGYVIGDGLNQNEDPLDEMGDNLDILNLPTSLKISQLSSGINHSCVLTDKNKVKCWGRPEWGQLGIGRSTENAIGDSTSEMGENLPFVNFGTGAIVSSISSRRNHSCAILSTNQIKCWGRNDKGQLGLGDGIIRGSDLSDMGDALPTIDLGTDELGAALTVKSLSVGGHHTCVILNNDRLKCWGSNEYGQLGLGHTSTIGDETNEMGNNLPYVNLGEGLKVIEISLGDYHTCARLDTGVLKCWGYNAYGQLGLGDKINRGSSPEQMGDALLSVDLGPE